MRILSAVGSGVAVILVDVWRTWSSKALIWLVHPSVHQPSAINCVSREAVKDSVIALGAEPPFNDRMRSQISFGFALAVMVKDFPVERLNE